MTLYNRVMGGRMPKHKAIQPKQQQYHSKYWIFFFLVVVGIILFQFLVTPKQEKAKNSLTAAQVLQDKPISFVLAGYGGGNHEGGNLTDSIMIVRVHPQEKTITYLSIPRDIWLLIPTIGEGGIDWKINAAYEIGGNDTDYPSKLAVYKGANGGANLLKAMVTKVTGIPTDYFIGINFGNFVRFINLLGGIDVNVETTFDDPEYPVEGKETDLCGATEAYLPRLLGIAETQSPAIAFPCRYEQLHFEKGITHMNGETALKYVRSRHGIADGTDFGRGARQRRFLIALKDKVLTPQTWPTLLPLIPQLKSLITTDIEPTKLLQLIPVGLDIASYRTRSIALSDANVLADSTSSDGQSILIPQKGVDNWAEVHAFVDHELNARIPTVDILNASGDPQNGSKAAQRLSAAGITVTTVKTATETARPQTQILTMTHDFSYSLMAKLESEFGVATTYDERLTTLKDSIQVIVGSNYGKE